MKLMFQNVIFYFMYLHVSYIKNGYFNKKIIKVF